MHELQIGRPAYQLARAAAGALVEGYFARVPGEWRRRLPVRYAGALLDKAVYFFRRQELDWRAPARTATSVLATAFSVSL